MKNKVWKIILYSKIPNKSQMYFISRFDFKYTAIVLPEDLNQLGKALCLKIASKPTKKSIMQCLPRISVRFYVDSWDGWYDYYAPLLWHGRFYVLSGCSHKNTDKLKVEVIFCLQSSIYCPHCPVWRWYCKATMW